MKNTLRNLCLVRDEYRCRKCSARFNQKNPMTLHHAIPQRLNGPDAYFNLICLCAPCHRAWHEHEDALDILWDATKTRDEFFYWLRGDFTEDDINNHIDCMDHYVEELLRSILHDLSRNKRRKKMPRNLRQTTLRR